ncbi:hypothetical protein CLIB1444_09S01090 [[Candida] jaroonii]|uniref:Uncharacterized protein n=1 Tax=[Candida] jaroonii TaxID=467808 RepID=A0ACA9YB81_9ASCO|nr:hypothetical protein CLIB1444_09S01090 [[Candida] jaroonii]
MRLFKRRSSVPEKSPNTQQPNQGRSLSFSGTTEELEEKEQVDLTDEYMISPTTSIPLSETETLNGDRDHLHRLELQNTYVENFNSYLPFVLRRLRLHQHENQSLGDGTIIEPNANFDDDDDLPTILDEPIDDPYGTTIMENNISRYSVKREFIIVNEFIKHNTYVFPSIESFELFRKLRNQNKKQRKNSITTYDNEEEKYNVIRGHETAGNSIIDDRNHIVPVEFKLEGQGLPIFRVSVPYMSNFRKNSPFIVFHKFKEIPNPPGNEDEEFETYPFCLVTLKRFQEIRRYTFEFPEYGFRVISFQHNFRPFADFNYKSTRFRVLGTNVISAFALNYNPSLKLLVIDEGKVSLCDSVINRKPGFEISSIIKKKQVKVEEDVSGLDPADYPNPYPAPDNPLLEDSYFQYYNSTGYTNVRDYIPNDLPPFGNFLDALVYKDRLNLIPKKYSEVGKIETYQDPHGDVNSTKSSSIDDMVLLCILMTYRESSIRANARPSNSSAMLSSRLSSSTASNSLILGTDFT